MEVTHLLPGEKAPANARYQAIDRFGEMLNVEIWCEAGERLPIIGVAGSYPVTYVRASEVTTATRKGSSAK
jgi:hypothetical protein